MAKTIHGTIQTNEGFFDHGVGGFLNNAASGTIGGLLELEALVPRMTVSNVQMAPGLSVPFPGFELGRTSLKDKFYDATGANPDSAVTKTCEWFCSWGPGLVAGVVRRAVTKAIVKGGTKTVAKTSIKNGASAGRLFASQDPYVAGTANAIEAVFPGRVVGVNGMRPMSNGLSREVDIDLGNLLVQVKSGNARGLTGQIDKTQRTTGVPTIGYAPGISDAGWRNAASEGIVILRSQDELIAYLKEFG